MVREGIDTTTLLKAVGHLPSSALPGSEGNLVLLGHRDTFFRPLRNIARGDSIYIRTREHSFTYQVESLEVVAPDSVSLAQSDSGPMATLITCFPFEYIGHASRRFLVRARLASGRGKASNDTQQRRQTTADRPAF
jgi:sortase A